MYRAVEPYRRVIEVVNGFQGSRILQMGVALDLFAKLANESKTLLQLARQLEVDSRALELLLNGLIALGLLAKDSDRYRATPLSQTYLVPGGPKYIGSLVLYQARRWTEWEHLGEAIRNGNRLRKPNPRTDDPPDLELYVRGLHELALARGDARYLAHVLPLQNCRKLLDLGDGPGTDAAMLCRSFPKLRAVVADLPATLKFTRRILREFDHTGNVRTLAVDAARDPIQGGPYDVALLSNISRGETAAADAGILRKVHDALVPGGLLVVKEHCMSADRTEPGHSAGFGLGLLLGARGRTYSLREMSGWIESAGFTDLVDIPPEPPMATSLLLALRPGAPALVAMPRPAARPISRPEVAAAIHDWWPASASPGSAPAASRVGVWPDPPAAKPSPARESTAAKDRTDSRATRVPKKKPAAKPKPAADQKSRPPSRSRRS